MGRAVDMALEDDQLVTVIGVGVGEVFLYLGVQGLVERAFLAEGDFAAVLQRGMIMLVKPLDEPAALRHVCWMVELGAQDFLAAAKWPAFSRSVMNDANASFADTGSTPALAA